MRRAARRGASLRVARAPPRPRRATCPTSRPPPGRSSRDGRRIARRAAHEAAGIAQQALRLRLRHPPSHHHNRELYTAARGCDRATRHRAVHTAALHHDTLAAVPQLVGERHQVHHEVAVCAPQPDHRPGRQRVEDELGGRTGLHAGRPRQGFRPDFRENEDVARLDQDRRGVGARDEPGRGADGLRAGQRRADERRRAARRDAEDEVRGCDAHLIHRRHPRVHVVLGAFAALHQRRVAARDHPDHHFRRRAERRRAFARVEHAEASGSPGADVDEPPPPAERAHHEVDGTGQLAAHRAHRSRHRRVLRVQEVDDFERRRDVDTLGAGVALLGEPRVAVVGNSHEGRRMAPKLDVDPNSGQRAQFGMRRALRLGLLVLAACSGGIKTPETIPVAPGVLPAIPAAIAPPVVDTSAKPAAGGGEAGPALVAADWPLTQRVKSVAGEHAMVVTSYPLAGDVGVDILRRGGNAVDAAVAVAFALAVVHPVAGNIGGGGFMVIRTHDGKVHALDFREGAPAGAGPNMYVDSAGNVRQSSLTGHLSVGVPGSVAGLYEAHRKLGRLPWRDLLAPAIHLARDGHVLDGPRSRQIAREAERLARFPASHAQFLVDGVAPAPETRFVQPDLARTLELVADSGAAVFYHGSIADLIVQEMKRGGGLITRQDLARYRAKWRDPIEIFYRGYTIYTMPPPSGGGVTLAEILNVMEGYEPQPAFGSAELMHLQTEAMRRAYTDRNTFLGDPDFVSMPLGRLLAKWYAGTLRAGIDRQHATPTAPVAGMRSEGTETTHFSIVDPEGNALSCTTTLNNDFGSAVTVTGAGFLLNDEMDDFSTAPGKPNLFGLVQGEANVIAPGKRMLSAMTPSIVLDTAGRLFLVLGSPGGSRIPTAVYQVLSDMVDQAMPLASAVAAPRLHHQAVPDTLHLERDGFVQAVIDSLEVMGHTVGVWNYKTEVNAIARAAAGWVGVADPRRGGGAAGY